MIDSKPCLAGCGNLILRQGMGPKHFAEKRYCSRACAAAHRKRLREGGGLKIPGQSRERSKAAMTAHWDIQRAIAKAKAARSGTRVNREDEVAAMERFAAERGVTRVEERSREDDPVRTTEYRPQVQPGWRG